MSTELEKIDEIKKFILSYPDFPKKNITFRDIFSILKEPRLFVQLRDIMIAHVETLQPKINSVVALDSRGFLFGPLIALHFGIPFVPIRKKGKLPGLLKTVTYDLEYGQDSFEVQADSIMDGDVVLIVDDLLATGGSLSAACQLVESCGAHVGECLVVMELLELNGRNKLSHKVHSLVQY